MKKKKLEIEKDAENPSIYKERETEYKQKN